MIPAAFLFAATVETGLDAVAAGDLALLRGKRLGLLAHAASVTADGRHAIDVLRAAGLDLRCVFAPEHGLRGHAAAGEGVRDGRDPVSGVPVISLYGAKTRPAPADLRDLDAVVVDLQDAGVRFYTYASTMLLTLEAAAEAGREVIVLDRPNPLGGELVEGPPSDPSSGVAPSLVNRTPGPLVHGLTLGEMALFANARLARPATLHVVRMRGWKRTMAWDDTGLRWVAPSPNLRSAEAALAYPGVCLLEATNVSEGRGTEAPFLRFGAPWLDAAALRAALGDAARQGGFGLEVVTFVPRAGPADPSPKHEGRECRGLAVRVIDPHAVRPYAFGVALLAALRQQPSFSWRDGGAALGWLVGGRGLFAGLAAGRGAAEILGDDAAAIAAFRRERAPVLLYGATSGDPAP